MNLSNSTTINKSFHSSRTLVFIDVVKTCCSHIQSGLCRAAPSDEGRWAWRTTDTTAPPPPPAAHSARRRWRWTCRRWSSRTYLSYAIRQRRAQEQTDIKISLLQWKSCNIPFTCRTRQIHRNLQKCTLLIKRLNVFERRLLCSPRLHLFD